VKDTIWDLILSLLEDKIFAISHSELPVYITKICNDKDQDSTNPRLYYGNRNVLVSYLIHNQKNKVWTLNKKNILFIYSNEVKENKEIWDDYWAAKTK
jgi:hypothetical protein